MVTVDWIPLLIALDENRPPSTGRPNAVGRNEMALIKCPECGNRISDRASMCPKCGCPSSEFSESDATSAEAVSDIEASKAEGLIVGKPDTAEKETDIPSYPIRIVKNDPDGGLSFISSDDENVYLRCGVCGKVYSFKRDYFDYVTEDGCTAPIKMECPACKKKCKETQASSENLDKPDFKQEKPREKLDKQSRGCLAGCGGVLGIVLTYVLVNTVLFPSFLPYLALLIASFAGIGYWFHSIPEPTAEESKRLEQMAEKQKYNGLKYTCPMCGGHRIKTIGTGRKVASAVTLGVAGRSLGKNYQCDDCNYRW